MPHRAAGGNGGSRLARCLYNSTRHGGTLPQVELPMIVVGVVFTLMFVAMLAVGVKMAKVFLAHPFKTLAALCVLLPAAGLGLMTYNALHAAPDEAPLAHHARR